MPAPVRRRTPVSRRTALIATISAIVLLAPAGVAAQGASGSDAHESGNGDATERRETRAEVRPAPGLWRAAVEVDNDEFNFWIHPAKRPDREYTSGVRVAFARPGGPGWARRLAPGRDVSCSAGGDDACLATRFEVGHEMYNPRRLPYSGPTWSEDRPYAAFLRGTWGVEAAAPRVLRATSLTVGGTGDLAFGEFAQRTAHKLNNYRYLPTGWETQIRTELGLLLEARQRALHTEGLDGARRVFDFSSDLGASLGNVRTGLDAGVRARLGRDLSHPWRRAPGEHRAKVEWYVVGGTSLHAVAHSLFLDGNTFDPRRSVQRTPLYVEGELGIALRLHAVTMSYRAVTRTKEYRTGPHRHTHGALALTVDAW